MRWRKQERYRTGFWVYVANIRNPKKIADIDPQTGRMIGAKRPYNGEVLCDHIAHNIPGALHTPANSEFRYSATTGGFIVVFA